MRRLGYRVLTVWECELKSSKKLERLKTRLATLFFSDATTARFESVRGDVLKACTSVAEDIAASGKPERFSLVANKAAIRRTVVRSDAREFTTTFQLVGRRPTRSDDEMRLAALADMAFLRQATWPEIDPSAATVRTVDLFSGCGAMTLGAWEACRAIGSRLEPVMAIDFNSLALKTYKQNFPGAVTICHDLDSILDGDLGDAPTETEKRFLGHLDGIDLLLGGPPCQGNSDLNNYTRRVDPKNRLYARMARFCELTLPTHVVIENVSAVLHDRGRVVDKTVAAIRALGYQVAHGVLDAGSLGAPQRRKRHVLVASKKRKVDLHALVVQHSRSPLTVGQAIAGLENTADDSAFDGSGRPTAKSLRRIDYLFEKHCYELPDRLRPACHREAEHSYKSVYGRMHWDRPAQTITSGFTCMGQGRYVHPKRRRTITPHEAARLQSIPDFFRFEGRTSRTALAEMIGNAVPTRLTYVLALELLR